MTATSVALMIKCYGGLPWRHRVFAYVTGAGINLIGRMPWSRRSICRLLSSRRVRGSRVSSSRKVCGSGCAAVRAAMRDNQVIGMPSHAVDEAWHGLILCTARYSAFCDKAYGRFLHHHPEGGAPENVPAATEPMHEQLRRTVIAWSMVAMPGEQCVLWDLDKHVGVEEPWGIDLGRVAAIQADLAQTRPAGLSPRHLGKSLTSSIVEVLR